MGILDGFAGGFWGDVDAERARNDRKDELNRQNERNVLTSLVNSPDVNDTVRKYALTGLLESASTNSKKRKGLHGFFGEMEKSDVLPHVSSLIDQMEAAGKQQQGPQAQPNLPSGHLNAQGTMAAAQAAPNITPQSFPSAAGAPPTLAPAPPARGAAAMPTESPVTGGDIHPSAAGVPGTQPSLGMLPQVPGFPTPSLGPPSAAMPVPEPRGPMPSGGAPPPVTPSNGPPTPSMASAAAPPAPAGAPVGAPPPSTSAFGAVQPPKPTPAQATGPQPGSGLDSKVFISPDERHILGMQTALKESGLYTDDEIKQIMRDNLDRYYGRTSGGGAGVGGTWSKGPLLQKSTGEWVQQLYLRGDPNQVKEIPAMDPRALSVGAVTPQEQAAADLFGQPGENPKVAYMRILRDGSGDQIDQINQKVNSNAAANTTATTLARKTTENANTMVPEEWASANDLPPGQTYGQIPYADSIHLITKEQRGMHDQGVELQRNIDTIKRLLPVVLDPKASPMANAARILELRAKRDQGMAMLDSAIDGSVNIAARALAMNRGATSEHDAERGYNMLGNMQLGLLHGMDTVDSAMGKLAVTEHSLKTVFSLYKTGKEQIEERRAQEEEDRKLTGGTKPVVVAPSSSATPAAAPVTPQAAAGAPAQTPTPAASATPKAAAAPAGTAPPMTSGTTNTISMDGVRAYAKAAGIKPSDALLIYQNKHYTITGQ